MRIEEYFDKARRFVATAAPQLEDTRLMAGCEVINNERAKGDGRAYMHVFHHEPRVVCVAWDAEALPARNLWGIYLHEFGHLLAGPGATEGQANLAVQHAFGIPIIYDTKMLQYVEDQYLDLLEGI